MPPAATVSSNLLLCDQPQCQSVADHPRRRFRELSLERSSSSNPNEPQICSRQSFSHHVVEQIPQTTLFLPRTGPFLRPQGTTLSRQHLRTVHPNSDEPVKNTSPPNVASRKINSVLHCSMTGQWAPRGEVLPVQGPKSTRAWLCTKPLSGPQQEIYPTSTVPELQRLSEVQKFRNFSSFPHLLQSSGPPSEYSGLLIQQTSTPMASERSEESLKSSMLSSLQRENFTSVKKNVRFREPLETFLTESPVNSEQEIEVVNEEKDSTVLPLYHPDVKFSKNRCCFENGSNMFIQQQQITTATRVRAGMDRPTGCGSSCCKPCKRSTCGSPWPSDVVQAQIAACASCKPPCPPPCCQMRYCPSPCCYYYQPKCCPRRRSGYEQKVCGTDGSGLFDIEEDIHHKHRGVSKDLQCGQTEVSENECRQRRQYGDGPPNSRPC